MVFGQKCGFQVNSIILSSERARKEEQNGADFISVHSNIPVRSYKGRNKFDQNVFNNLKGSLISTQSLSISKSGFTVLNISIDTNCKPTGAVSIGGGLFSSVLVSNITNVSCSGSEATLLDCAVQFSQQCTSGEDAAVLCQGMHC